MIAEQLATAIAAQCMLWQTSPAATEMEQVMIDWLRQATGLPEGFSGTLQDSASTATPETPPLGVKCCRWMCSRLAPEAVTQSRSARST